MIDKNMIYRLTKSGVIPCYRPNELKPFPFCGSEAIVPAMPIGITDDDTPVECTNMDCDASEVTFDKGAWKTRPIEDALNSRIAELEAEVAELRKTAVVWHKYSDEKPIKQDWYLTSYRGEIS